MKVLKICTGTWENASRDQRELSVCRELGADTIVLAKGDAEDRGREDEVNGFKVHRYTTRPFKHIPVSLNRLVSIFQWAKYVGTLEPDVISGHDIDGWIIGWLSKFYNHKKRPLLVYDSHEFELGRNADRNRFQLFAMKCWEKKVINSSVFTIVVNDSIADELVKIYKLKKRPVVARNIPSKWEIDKNVCEETRKELLEMFGGGEKYILIYHGAICRNRGIEQLLAAVRKLDDTGLLLLGNPESQEYMQGLTEKYIHGKTGRVIVKKAVPHAQLWKYIGAADLCLAPIIPKYRSYYFALPNKLFEAIQAETPVLASNLPEMRKIIENYGIGEVVNPDDEHIFAAKIMEMEQKGKRFYRFNLSRAKEELTWENEKGMLKKEYSKILK